MKICYEKSGKLCEIEKSNEDLEIKEERYGNRQKIILKSFCEVTLKFAELVENHQFFKDDLVFLNGYQSWTDSFEYSISAKIKNIKNIPGFLLNKYAFDKYGDAAFYNYEKNTLHAFDVSYVKGKNPLFIGNLNYKTAYLIIEYHKKRNEIVIKSDLEGLKIKSGEDVTIFDFVQMDDVIKGQEEYFSSFINRKAAKMCGYTSWYNHYQNINEGIIAKTLSYISEDFELFQIDDGYETFVGDWLNVDKTKFPKGLKPIVDKIHQKGLKAGIWIAPFVAEKNSEIFQKHPDYFIKNENNVPLYCGSNWSGFYALDINNPEVINYLQKVFKELKEQCFDFYKLDFLHAVSILPANGETRAQTARKAYEFLRSELGDKLILGCGAVVSSSFEIFDYLRIGPDVSLIFDDIWYMRKMHRERISTKVTIQNTIFRNIFDNKVFLNDPDVFLLRDKNIKLSEQQRKALTTINALCGSLFMTSDNPGDYDEVQMKNFKTGLELFYKAELCSVNKKKNRIFLEYMMGGQKYFIKYNTKKGILE